MANAAFLSGEDFKTLRKEFAVHKRRGSVAMEHRLGVTLLSAALAHVEKTPAVLQALLRQAQNTKADYEAKQHQVHDNLWLSSHGFIYRPKVWGKYTITPRGLLLLAVQHDQLRHMGRGGYDHWVLNIPRTLHGEIRSAIREWESGNREGFAANPREPNPGPNAAALASKLKF